MGTLVTTQYIMKKKVPIPPQPPFYIKKVLVTQVVDEVTGHRHATEADLDVENLTPDQKVAVETMDMHTLEKVIVGRPVRREFVPDQDPPAETVASDTTVRQAPPAPGGAARKKTTKAERLADQEGEEKTDG